MTIDRYAREELIEETKRERAQEKINDYLRSLDVQDLLEIIPEIFNVDIEDALIDIIREYDLVYLDRFNDISFK